MLLTNRRVRRSIALRRGGAAESGSLMVMRGAVMEPWRLLTLGELFELAEVRGLDSLPFIVDLIHTLRDPLNLPDRRGGVDTQRVENVDEVAHA